MQLNADPNTPAPLHDQTSESATAPVSHFQQRPAEPDNAQPGQFVLASTERFFNLPNNIAAAPDTCATDAAAATTTTQEARAKFFSLLPPPPPSKHTKKAQQRQSRVIEEMLKRGVPPLMCAHIRRECTSITAAHKVADAYFSGCQMTGVQFNDRYHARKNTTPLAAVKRADGRYVCYAVWLLSQEGAISDAVLVNTARAITRHHSPATAHQPPPPPPPPPPPATHHTPPPPNIGDLYGNSFDDLYATTELGMGGDDCDDGHTSDTHGHPEPAEHGVRAGRWKWNDSTAAVEFYPE
jgi:hypothetical protein